MLEQAINCPEPLQMKRMNSNSLSIMSHDDTKPESNSRQERTEESENSVLSLGDFLNFEDEMVAADTPLWFIFHSNNAYIIWLEVSPAATMENRGALMMRLLPKLWFSDVQFLV